MRIEKLMYIQIAVSLSRDEIESNVCHQRSMRLSFGLFCRVEAGFGRRVLRVVWSGEKAMDAERLRGFTVEPSVILIVLRLGKVD